MSFLASSAYHDEKTLNIVVNDGSMQIQLFVEVGSANLLSIGACCNLSVTSAR